MAEKKQLEGKAYISSLFNSQVFIYLFKYKKQEIQAYLQVIMSNNLAPQASKF